MKNPRPHRRRFIVPEVVQISNMDCGPASLKCLLEGFGVPASYGRLREVCQTEVDGTSINAIEDAASQLGMTAEQVLLPADHLVLPEGKSLPAIAVVRLPTGATHFVVVWRRLGHLLQIMDPAGGRRWVPVDRFLSDLHVHAQDVPERAWRRWAGSDDSIRVLRSQLARAGLSELDTETLLGEALADESWKSIAALDAAARMTNDLVQSGGVPRGKDAARILRKFYERALREGDGPDCVIPDHYWTVRGGAEEHAERRVLAVRGVVFIRVKGISREGAPVGEDEVSARRQAELATALSDKDHHTLWRLFQIVGADGWLLPTVVTLAVGVSAGALFVEGLLLRSLLDIGSMMSLGYERAAAAVVLVSFLILATALELPVAALGFRLGRRLEGRLRLAFLTGIPLLRDRYFQSRLVSDMVERCHSMHTLRSFPPIMIQLLRSGATLVVLAAGIIWLDPSGAPWIVCIAALSVALPLVGQSMLSERDLRLRSHGAALVRFYLDSMLGLLPIRALCAERVIRREHEAILVAWVRAALGVARTILSLDAAVAIATLAMIGLELHHIVVRIDPTSDALLLVYWVLLMPPVGQELAGILRLLPPMRNTAARLLEPIGEQKRSAHNDALKTDNHIADEPGPLSVRFEDVCVRAGGHSILEQISLDIEAGSHVAIAGPSGAGKSTLVGLLLGWHEPSAGRVVVNGSVLSVSNVSSLRRRTAWVDPAVHLWNRTLMENLSYGSGDAAGRSLSGALDAADLTDLIASLPDGMQTKLGENGAILSGGEGQRVRLGRGLLRNDASLVILDEPFRGLDRGMRQELLAATRKWFSGATILCITHDVEDTRFFDRVVVMAGGRIVEQGTASELASRADSAYAQTLQAAGELQRDLQEIADWRRVTLSGGIISPASREEKAP
ncbi:hypothetical protein B7486_15460 [cyanobacterium TDX16]|nr:hypothetical protein B7486_15460 [cyanobacterium TDX16]